MTVYILTLRPEDLVYSLAVYVAGFAASVFILRWAFGINRLLNRVKATNALLSIIARNGGADPAEIEKIINHAEGNV